MSSVRDRLAAARTAAKEDDGNNVRRAVRVPSGPVKTQQEESAVLSDTAGSGVRARLKNARTLARQEDRTRYAGAGASTSPSAGATENDADTRENPGVIQRIWEGFKKTNIGGAKGSLAANTNALTTLYQTGQAGRTARNREALEEYSHGLERAKHDMEIMLEDNRNSPGTWRDVDIRSQQNIIDDWQRKYDATAKVLGENIQERATEESYRLSDDIQASGARDIERAKEVAYFGDVGDVLVDAGASMTQMALDAGGNVLLGTPGSMAPFAVRAFGGGAQEARQDGADLEGQIMYGGAQAAKELLTEKMFNLALPFNKVYGGGALDDAVERGIRRAVDRFAKTELGKRALGGALKFGAGAVGEGLEEFIGDWMEWQMPRIYGGDVATAGDTLENSLYDFLVGAASGAMGGAVDPSTYRYDAGVEMAGAETAESYRPLRHGAAWTAVPCGGAVRAGHQDHTWGQCPQGGGEHLRT